MDLLDTHSRFGKLRLENASLKSRSTSSAFLSRDATPAGGYSSTQPMAMPSMGRVDHSHNSLQDPGGGKGTGFMSSSLLSPIEKASRGRKSSISFDPQVRLDSGSHQPLQTPLPRPIRMDSSGGSYESRRPRPPRPPTRQGSESERFLFEFNSGFTSGELSGSYRSGGGGGHSYGSSGGGSFRERRTQAHRLLLPQPMDEENDQVASLTSDSTMSPMSEDFHTPPPPRNPFGDFFSSPRTKPSLLGDSLSFQEASGWSGSGSDRRLGSSHRNKSFSYDPRPRSLSRHDRRAFSERAASPACRGSTPLSPANMFLNSFNSSGPAQPVEPDSEGQEVGSYVLGKQIGFGGFSVVKEATTIEGDRHIVRAVKIVRKDVPDHDTENDQIQAEFDHEVSLWRCLSHPNILKLIAVYDTPFATFAFTPLNKGGTLYDLIKTNRQGISARLVQRYSFQLACAMRYLHEDMRIIHRDIKLENCLLDISTNKEEGGNLLLCDFGMAEFMKGSDDDDDSDSDNGDSYDRSSRRNIASADGSTSLVGSLQYASPEMIGCDQPICTAAADMWAYGVLIYALCTGVLPFQHTFQPKLQAMIAKGEWDIERLRGSRCLTEMGRVEGEKIVEVVRGCLNKNFERRWCIRTVLESRLFEAFGGESP